MTCEHSEDSTLEVVCERSFGWTPYVIMDIDRNRLLFLIIGYIHVGFTFTSLRLVCDSLTDIVLGVIFPYLRV